MFKPDEQMLQLKAFLSAVPEGAYITYADIQEGSGVKMNTRGKQLMRSAMGSLKREYRCDAGKGIEMESAKNCMHLVTGRVNKVSKSLKRADKTSTVMMERYVEQLPVAERNQLVATASLFGAIKTMAKGLSAIYKKPKTLNTVNTERLPKTW